MIEVGRLLVIKFMIRINDEPNNAAVGRRSVLSPSSLIVRTSSSSLWLGNGHHHRRFLAVGCLVVIFCDAIIVTIVTSRHPLHYDVALRSDGLKRVGFLNCVLKYHFH